MVISDHAVEYRLARDPQSVGEARRIVSELLRDREENDLVDTALLLVSELVANAVRYGEEPITLDVVPDDDEVTIGVSDGGDELPTLTAVGPPLVVSGDELAGREAIGGRGLRLIATLADAWDVEKRMVGKRVWFALRSPVHR